MPIPLALPCLFVAHGSPMLALEGGAWSEVIGALGRSLPHPRAILVCSAHWESPDAFRLSSAARPGVMHDFGGFPDELYALDYPAPGAPEVAEEAQGLLQGAGFGAILDPVRKLDHGAWVPLRYLAPEAHIPVLQLSLPLFRTPEALLAAGKALVPLRETGVLILGSGGIVHNLGRLDWAGHGSPQPWALAFQAWIDDRLASGDTAGLLDWPNAPGARESVPTSEHLDPLFLFLGASRGLPVPLFTGWQLGSLSLASYRAE